MQECAIMPIHKNLRKTISSHITLSSCPLQRMTPNNDSTCLRDGAHIYLAWSGHRDPGCCFSGTKAYGWVRYVNDNVWTSGDPPNTLTSLNTKTN